VPNLSDLAPDAKEYQPIIARKSDRRTLQITLLLTADGPLQYGTDTEYGRLWKPTKDELFKALRFIFKVKKIEAVNSRLTL
jgi:hypothetical protein